MPLRQMLRSLPDYSYFVTILLVNVPGWLSRHRPGDPGFWHKIAATRYIRLISYGYRVRARGNIPVRRALPRIPARRPGLQKTSHRFSAGLKPSLQLFYSHEHYLRGYQYLLLRCQRLIHPAIELLLVGFDPAINVALNIAF